MLLILSIMDMRSSSSAWFLHDQHRPLPGVLHLHAEARRPSPSAVEPPGSGAARHRSLQLVADEFDRAVGHALLVVPGVVPATGDELHGGVDRALALGPAELL